MEKVYKIDVPVYLNFFNRPETFKLVFEAVKQASAEKMQLFSSNGKANVAADNLLLASDEIKKIVELVTAEVRKQMNK